MDRHGRLAEVAGPGPRALAASAHPSGLVDRTAYEEMCQAIVGAVRDGCDAVFLALHGAMVAEHVDDGEGELLRRIRIVAPRLPVAHLGPAWPSAVSVETFRRLHRELAPRARAELSSLLGD